MIDWDNPVIDCIPRTTDAMLKALAKRIPLKAAVQDSQQCLSFAELNAKSLRIAHTLMHYRLTPGQTVFLDLPVGTELLLAFLGATRMGLAVLYLHKLLSPEETEALIKQLQPAACIGQTFHHLELPVYPLADLLNFLGTRFEYPTPVENTLAVIRTTSGTTGCPKLIAVNHAHLCRRLPNPGKHYAEKYRYGCSLPYFFPSYQIITALGAGGTVIFHPAVTAIQIEKFIVEAEISFFWGVPAFFEQVALEKSPLTHNLSSLKAAVSSSAHLSPSTMEIVAKRWKVPLYQFYGQSELGFFTETDLETPFGSVGKPVTGVELRVIDQFGIPLVSGQTGQIQVQTDPPFGGYLSGESTPLDPEGWFNTGDLGYLDEHGNLFLNGRLNRLIQVGGLKVAPEEVEAVIGRMFGVKDVYVFGEPHPIRGEKVAAAVTAPGLTSLNIRSFCRKHLARYKCPFNVYFLPELPRTGLGKVNGPRLRELIQPTENVPEENISISI